MYSVGDVVKYQTIRVITEIRTYDAETKIGTIVERIFSPYVSANFYWIEGESKLISESQILGKEKKNETSNS